MRAVILAAGRGSRMKAQTEQRPKCLLELGGKPLLQWQMHALREAGAKDILVVRGYLGHMLAPQNLPWAGSFQTVDNPWWAQSNMLRTLVCADVYVREAFASGVRRVVISYADIVYPSEHVRALTTCEQDIAITFDELWEPLWRLRFGDPLLDAETFRQEGGVLRDIGGKPRSLSEIHGQYMGLLAFTSRGWDSLMQTCAALGDAVDTTDMTGFLRDLMARNVLVGAVPVQGRWCEADNEADIRNYETALAQGDWSHDWR